MKKSKINYIKTNIKQGFTLAEVLITLGIIGTVAALTIPTLIQKNQEAQCITGLTKFYSTISQAHKIAVQDNGTVDTWDLANKPDNIINTWNSYLKITKYCGTGTGCWPDINYRKYTGKSTTITYDTNTNYFKAQLSNGVSLAIPIAANFNDCNDTLYNPTSPLSKICTTLYADINGFSGPNEFGVDFFGFYVAKDQIIPYGIQGDPNHDSFSGVGLPTAWVLYNGNMDYRRCASSLGWNSKITCD